MSKGKISVRRELREPDAFVKTTYSTLSYISQYRKIITIATGIVIALLTTTIGAYWYKHSLEQKAGNALNQALYALATAAPDTAVEQKLQSIITTYAHSSVRPLADYLSGNLKYRSGQPQEAAAFYHEKRKNSNRRIRDLEDFSLAAIAFEEKDYTSAISILEQLQSQRSFITEDLYILLGLSYEKSGQVEKAAANYNNMIQRIKNSVFKPWAEERLLALRNQA
ncbi:MAG: tetratricopeptide repeat protein [Deltaproteobacteria bacterium]|nr:tetratricopeptide repeat protein [Deltaproteobacteria bacterium]